MMIAASIASAGTAFWVGKKLFPHQEKAPYLLTLFYQFSHYHLLTAHVRYALGEVFALIWIPLLLYVMVSIFVYQKKHWILLGVLFSLLLLSHNLTFLMYCFFYAFIYLVSLIHYRNKFSVIKEFTLVSIKGTLLALGLSAFFLAPMIEQLLYLDFNVEIFSSLYNVHQTAQSIQSIFVPWMTIASDYTLFFTQMSMGLPLVILPILLLGKREKPRHFLLLGICHIIFLLGITGIIIPKSFTAINTLQFLFRIYMLAFPLACYCSTYYLVKLDVKYRHLFLVICVGLSLGNLLPFYWDLNKSSYQLRNTQTKEEIFDFQHLINTYDQNIIEISGAEYLPPTEKVNYLKDSHHIKEVINNHEYNEIIYEHQYIRRGTYIEFTYDSDKEKVIYLPQTYYKGYQAFLYNDDGSVEKLETFSEPYFGQVAFRSKEGENHYFSRYVGTTVQKVSLAVSTSSFLAMLYYWFRKRKICKER